MPGIIFCFAISHHSPRGGDFLYTDDEFAIMLQDVKLCKQLGLRWHRDWYAKYGWND